MGTMVVGLCFHRTLPADLDFRWSLCNRKSRMTALAVREAGVVNFSATIRHNGQVSIIDLTGELTSFASGALRNTIADLMRQGRKKIVLNVGELVYLDSSGVGELVNCYMSVIKQTGEMKVVGL